MFSSFLARHAIIADITALRSARNPSARWAEQLGTSREAAQALEVVWVEAAVADSQEMVEDPIEEVSTVVRRSGMPDTPLDEANTISSLTRTIVGATRATATSAAVEIGIEGMARIQGGSVVEAVIGIGNGTGGGRRVDMSVGGRALGVRKIGTAIESGVTAIGGKTGRCNTTQCETSRTCRLPIPISRNSQVRIRRT
jgi:hypothetical protein